MSVTLDTTNYKLNSDGTYSTLSSPPAINYVQNSSGSFCFNHI